MAYRDLKWDSSRGYYVGHLPSFAVEVQVGLRRLKEWLGEIPERVEIPESTIDEAYLSFRVVQCEF